MATAAEFHQELNQSLAILCNGDLTPLSFAQDKFDSEQIQSLQSLQTRMSQINQQNQSIALKIYYCKKKLTQMLLVKMS